VLSAKPYTLFLHRDCFFLSCSCVVYSLFTRAFNFNPTISYFRRSPKDFFEILGYGSFHDKIYRISNSYLFLLPRWEMPHLCYLQYIYCRIVKDHKGEEKGGFSERYIDRYFRDEESSKLFYGKVSPIVTTTKKRPCHFATYGSSKARELDYFRTNVSPARTMLSYTCLLETTFSQLVGNGRPLSER